MTLLWNRQQAPSRAILLRWAGSTVVLSGWKEIAQYLNCGVRTVQRREREGLPIRRIGAGPQSPVFAYAKEIDYWLNTRRLERGSSRIADIQRSRELRQQLQSSREELRQRMADLRKELATLRVTRGNKQFFNR